MYRLIYTYGEPNMLFKREFLSKFTMDTFIESGKKLDLRIIDVKELEYETTKKETR